MFAILSAAVLATASIQIDLALIDTGKGTTVNYNIRSHGLPLPNAIQILAAILSDLAEEERQNRIREINE